MSMVGGGGGIILNDAARVWLTYTRARSGPPSPSPSCLLVHPHIVQPHGLREYGGGVRITGPVPADGNVQNDEERVIEHPLPGYFPRRRGLVERIVDVPSNRARFPLDGIDVKTVGEGARAQLVRAGDALGTRVAGPVYGAVHAAGLPADVLHDVDLTAGGPTDSG